MRYSCRQSIQLILFFFSRFCRMATSSFLYWCVGSLVPSFLYVALSLIKVSHLCWYSSEYPKQLQVYIYQPVKSGCSQESMTRSWDHVSARSRVQHPRHPADEDWSIGRKFQVWKYFQGCDQELNQIVSKYQHRWTFTLDTLMYFPALQRIAAKYCVLGTSKRVSL